MSSEDVIELVSSDDEREPAPKKKKALPNAMVRIPNPHTNLPAITIKPTKVRTSSINKLIPEKYKPTPMKRIQINNQCNIHTKASKHTMLLNNHLGKVITSPANIVNKTNFSKNPKPTGSKLLKNLPSSITVKRAVNTSIRNSVIIPIKKRKLLKNPVTRVVHTVEIDDELPETSKSIPQWYKRPEEQENENNSTEGKVKQESKISFEEKNNKEPIKFIEITIEDSPVKPVPTKRTDEVSNSITIEDSPVKCVEDISNVLQHKEDKQSKKKLDYPQVKVAQDNNGMIEIEIDPIETGAYAATKNKENDESAQPENKVKHQKTEVRVCKKNTQEGKVENFVKEPEKSVSDGEFNAVYQKFINTCFCFENSKDMKQIVEKKIKAYYRKCSKEYVDSETFTDFVSGKILAINASPRKIYLYIKDVVDELNMQRSLEKADKEKNIKDETQTESKGNETFTSEYNTKHQSQIQKLEKTLKKLHRAIQKLEEQEVDFDDDDDSVYLLTERYKDRILRVHAKFCQLTHTKLPSEPYIKLETQPGRPAGPVRRLEKWINKRVPIGKPLPFPDFHDVLSCVREANVEDKIGWSEMEILEEARQLFTTCGNKLKRRRQENEWRIAASRGPVYEDPAENDDDLKKKLEENKLLAIKKEADVFNRFVDRQNQLKLEPEEIGDKEAEESSVESGEDNDNDENTILKDKEERKHRLKRLLQKKSKKVSEKKENSSKSLEIMKNDDNVMNVDRVGVEERNSNMAQKHNTHKEKEGESSNEISAISEKHENNIESDVDELHLLQKLYSESDSESPINLTDSENEDKAIREVSNDVISIEDSSYSESENGKANSNDSDIENAKKNMSADPNDVKITSETLCDKSDTTVVQSGDKRRVSLSVEVTREIQEILSMKQNGDSENLKKNLESSIKGSGIMNKNIECDISNTEINPNVLASSDENNHKKSNILHSVKISDSINENVSASEKTSDSESKDVYDENKNKESRTVDSNICKNQVIAENVLAPSDDKCKSASAMISDGSKETLILNKESAEESKDIPLSIETIGSSSSEEDISGKNVSDDETENCVNLGDDNISISDICIGNIVSIQNDGSEIEAGLIKIDCKDYVKDNEDNGKALTSSNESRSVDQNQRELESSNDKETNAIETVDKINTQETNIMNKKTDSTESKEEIEHK